MGERFYSWATRAEAEGYKGLLEQTYKVDDLVIVEAKIDADTYGGLNTIDLRAMAADEWDAWHASFTTYGENHPHGFDHVIRNAAAGNEFYFSKDVFHHFQLLLRTP